MGKRKKARRGTAKAGSGSLRGLGTVKKEKSRASTGEKLKEAAKVGGGVLLGIVLGRAAKNTVDSLMKPTGMMRFIPPVIELGIGTGAVLLAPKRSFISYMGVGALVAGGIDAVNEGIGQFVGPYQVDNLKIMEMIKGEPTLDPTGTGKTNGFGQIRYLQLPGAVDLPVLNKTATILGNRSGFDVDKIL